MSQLKASVFACTKNNNMKTVYTSIFWQLELYPFGSSLVGRQKTPDNYRYGFNNAEKDDEISGIGNTYDLGARMYNPRLGRMFSPDPREKEYPWQSTYAYYRNSPIWKLDYKGEGGDKIIEKPEIDNEPIDKNVGILDVLKMAAETLSRAGSKMAKKAIPLLNALEVADNVTELYEKSGAKDKVNESFKKEVRDTSVHEEANEGKGFVEWIVNGAQDFVNSAVYLFTPSVSTYTDDNGKTVKWNTKTGDIIHE